MSTQNINVLIASTGTNKLYSNGKITSTKGYFYAYKWVNGNIERKEIHSSFSSLGDLIKQGYNKFY